MWRFYAGNLGLVYFVRTKDFTIEPEMEPACRSHADASAHAFSLV